MSGGQHRAGALEHDLAVLRVHDHGLAGAELLPQELLGERSSTRRWIVHRSAERRGQVVRNVELFLCRNVIHGDLSPYNVLVWDGRVTVIDLPQAVDPRKNRHARGLLERDVERIVEHFSPLGVRASARRISSDLWTAWEFADLVPEELRGLV